MVTRPAFALLTMIAGFLLALGPFNLVLGHQSLGETLLHKEEGWQAYGSGELTRAEDLWSKDLESAKARGNSSLIAEAQYRLAHIHAARAEYDKAIELLRQSMHLVDADDPVFTLSAQKLVSTFESAGRDEDAEKLLRALISSRERSELHTDLTLRLRLAEVYRRSGRLTMAEKVHREALADAVRQTGSRYMNILLVSHFDALASLYEAMEGTRRRLTFSVRSSK